MSCDATCTGIITNKRDTNRTQTFTYDALNRLVQAKTQATSGSTCWGQEHSYDVWANLLSITGYGGCTQTGLSVAVNANNRITTSGHAGVYPERSRRDPAGNMTTIAGISGSITYDGEGRMKTAAGRACAGELGRSLVD